MSRGGKVDPAHLASLQQHQERVRNICILAHVDHGKTTISDHLVCSNGLISSKLAGKLRFLDSTEEEQRRGITIHSSAISLVFRLEEKGKKAIASETEGTEPAVTEYLINLIDCPGHIDFSSDVSTATRLCDGAIILVDVLEGVCTQTRAVLHKALKERMRPCLVLNKIDRLCLEMKLTPLEAFYHLRKVLENVNALAAQLVNSELNISAHSDKSQWSDELSEGWIFGSERGNVLFASALDSWGFGVAKFANHWALKMGLNREVLVKYMFEDYTLLASTKKIVKCTEEYRDCKPLFASLVLEPIWAIYDAAISEHNPEKASKMAKRALDIELEPREVNSKDPRSTVQAIFRRWLPLSDALLRMVVRCVPDPISAQQKRILTLYPPLPVTAPGDIQALRESIACCRMGIEEETVVFVSKMMPVRLAELRKADVEMLRRVWESSRVASGAGEGGEDATDTNKFEDILSVDSEVMMALARVFCGVLSPDKELFILGNRYDPTSLEEDTDSSRIRRVSPGSFALYIPYGPSVFPIDRVPAGNIVGIVGFDTLISKTATLSTSRKCYPMRSITFQAIPMVRVAVEPTNHSNLKILEKGLQNLYQYDPAVEVDVEESGQFTICCLGELHLEQCMKMLSEKLCKCELRASEPLVQFRESICQPDRSYQRKSILPSPWGSTEGLETVVGGVKRFTSCSNQIAVTIRCLALPSDTAALLMQDEDNVSQLQNLVRQKNWVDFDSITLTEVDNLNEFLAKLIVSLDNDEEKFSGHILKSCEDPNEEFYKNLLSLGSAARSTILMFSPNLSVSCCTGEDILDLTHLNRGSFEIKFEEISKSTVDHWRIFSKVWSRLHTAVVAGFQATTTAGPLMLEPLHGVLFMVERIELTQTALLDCGVTEEDVRSLGIGASIGSRGGSAISINLGQLISDTTAAFRLAMLASPVRLVEPIYACDLQCDQSQLRNLYAVLSRRRGVIVNEDIIEGTSLFLLTASIPIAESFGFAQELLERTGGNAISPQLSFSHWSKFDTDPFWQPTTTEELEDFGSQSTEINKARVFIDKVRRRKGLPVEEKVVESAEKQRTLSKKK